MKPIQSRLLLLVAASVALCAAVTVMSAAVIRSADNSLAEDKINENRASMQQTAAAVQKELSARYDYLLDAANDLSSENEQDFDAILRRAQKKLSAYTKKGNFEQVLLADISGTAYNADGESFDVSPRKYFRRAVIGNSGVSERVDAPAASGLDEAIVYYAPVYAGDMPVAVLLGVAPASLDLSDYEEDPGALSGVYILDGSGKFVMTSALADGSSFYDFVKDSRFADGDDKAYQEWTTPAATSAEAQDGAEEDETAALTDETACFYAGSIAESEGLFGWLSRKDSFSRVYLRQSLDQNDWQLFYVRVLPLSASTAAFRRLIRALLVSVVTLLFAALVVMLLFEWRSGRKIAELAYKDDVTGRANWHRFRAVAKRRLRSKSWWRTNHALLHICVNRFAVYNEYYGHKAADGLLRYIAETLDLMCSAKELSARRAGEQFVALWSYSDKEQLDSRIQEFFDLLRDGEGGENLSVTVGVYLLGEEDKNIVEAADLAALAGENAESGSHSVVAYFDESIRARLNEERELEDLMHAALDNGEFKLYLQPKHRVQDGSLGGAEALVRWISPQKGFISPGRFIPLFEKNGFVDDVDNYILEQLCIFQQNRLLRHEPVVPISVNVSRVQLSDPDLAQKICAIVDRHDVPHRLIDLELTESASFDDLDVLIHTIDAMRDMGFPVSMDDFGSGYSSLNLLKQLSFDTLKIDGEFFRNVTDPARADAVVRSIIDMAKSLGMKTVAEGIETDEQVAFLRTTDCDLIQGYYYSKPISAEEFEKYMNRNTVIENKE